MSITQQHFNALALKLAGEIVANAAAGIDTERAILLDARRLLSEPIREPLDDRDIDAVAMTNTRRRPEHPTCDCGAGIGSGSHSARCSIYSDAELDARIARVRAACTCPKSGPNAPTVGMMRSPAIIVGHSPRCPGLPIFWGDE